MLHKQPNGFTLVELLIVFAISGIAIAIAIGVGVMNGNSIFPSRQSCISQGGKWTEGIQFGGQTAFCTYN